MYRIDLFFPNLVTPCSYVQSKNNPAKTLCVNEDGSSLCVEPNGSQVRTIPASDPNWDSPYTQGERVDEFLVYRSPYPNGDAGTPRAYRVLGA